MLRSREKVILSAGVCAGGFMRKDDAGVTTAVDGNFRENHMAGRAAINTKLTCWHVH